MSAMTTVVTNTDSVETEVNCAIKEEKPRMEFQLIFDRDEHNFNQSFKLDVEDIKIKLEPLIKEEIDIKDEIRETVPTDNDCDIECSAKSFISNSHSQISKSNGELHKCKIRNCQCAHKSHLHRHLKTHTSEKPYKCSICEYQCAQKGHLQSHLRTHTGEKPYKCKICGCQCSQKGSLQRHLRTHTGEKPHKCNICDYKYARNCDLQRHLRTHTGEKPYKCNICYYKCARKGYLQSHLRIHTGEKPYQCNICEYKCARKDHTQNHLRTHTGLNLTIATSDQCTWKSDATVFKIAY